MTTISEQLCHCHTLFHGLLELALASVFN